AAGLVLLLAIEEAPLGGAGRRLDAHRPRSGLPLQGVHEVGDALADPLTLPAHVGVPEDGGAPAGALVFGPLPQAGEDPAQFLCEVLLPRELALDGSGGPADGRRHALAFEALQHAGVDGEAVFHLRFEVDAQVALLDE